MKKSYLLAMLFCSCFLFAQKATLEVRISHFDNNKGKVFVGVCNSKNDFLKVFFKGGISKIENKKATVVFLDLPIGEYAISVFHDENENNMLDSSFIGIPKEDFGFSNNAKGIFGPPKYDAAKFNLKNNTTIDIAL